MSDSRTASSARRTLIAAIVALTFASIAYRLLIGANLQHTSLVFIGIPALLALSLVGLQPRTSAGTVHKTIALALCMSGIVFGEGFICIVMASPLFLNCSSCASTSERNSAGSPLEDTASRVSPTTV